MKTKDKIFNLLKKKHPEIKIIGDYINSETHLLCKDEFGEVKLNIGYHIRKGNKPTIQSAVNKSSYWVNFINNKHNNDYDYSKVEYKGNKIPVIIGCKKHGDFKVSPNDHDNKQSNCPKCTYGTLKYNTESFVKEAIKKHKNRYDYNKIIYTGIRGLINVICPVHGEITMTAYQHLHTSGCYKCGYSLNNSGYSITVAKRKMNEYKNTLAYLYLMKLHNENESFLKVGITKNDPKHRGYTFKYNSEIIDVIKTNLFDAIYLEDMIIANNRDNKYFPLVKFKGYTECFKKKYI